MRRIVLMRSISDSHTRRLSNNTHHIEDDMKEFRLESVFCFSPPAHILSRIDWELRELNGTSCFYHQPPHRQPPRRPRLDQIHLAVFAQQHVTSAETQACLESPGVRPRPLYARSLALSHTQSHFGFTFLPVKPTHTGAAVLRAETWECGCKAPPRRPSCAPGARRGRRCSALWGECGSRAPFN